MLSTKFGKGALLLSLIFLTAFTIHKLKKNYPQDYFGSPVAHTLRLSGTFGELRPNHFHAGIDIKPSAGGKLGDPLFSIADGFVSRIKIAPNGYGKCIYIDHPNGYTSVYAHLRNFPDAIEDFIKEKQYEKESFSLDIKTEDKAPLRVKKGETIGYLGLTGGSQGAHLHFEIRDTKTEKPINPLLFGYKVADDKKPKMHQLKVYGLDPDRQTVFDKVYSLNQGSNRYYIRGDTLRIGAWRAGFGMKVYDHMNEVSNWNGIYALEMYADDSLVYNFEMETFSFDETRFLNAHIDYEEQRTKKSYFNRCYTLPGNDLSIYGNRVNDGVIELSEKKPVKVEIICKDVEGNEARLMFFALRGKAQKPKEASVFNYTIDCREASTIKQQGLELEFPAGAFYQKIYLPCRPLDLNKPNQFSTVYQVGDAYTPVHVPFKISLSGEDVPARLRSKALIINEDNKGRLSTLGGKWQGEMLQTTSKYMGEFYITTDTIAPKITPKVFNSSLKGYSRMAFRLTDELSGITKYRGTVDGKWILMEFDQKSGTLTHYFDERTQAGKHEFELEVQDERGNTSTFKKTFYR